MDLQSYEQQLQCVAKELQKYDGNLADSDYKELQKMFETVFQSGVLKITKLPLKEQDEYKLLLFSYLSRSCGTLSFLIIQILAAHNIMQKNSFSLTEYVTDKRCGIAVNHLRAPVTIVDAKKCQGGYRLNGTLRWASGYKIFDSLLIGFHCNDQEFEAVASFCSQTGFTIGKAEKTFVGFGLHTVDIVLQDYFISEDAVVCSKPLGDYTKQKSASKTVHFCFYALANYALELSTDKEFQNKGYEKLQTLQKKFMESEDTEELDRLRVELFLSAQQIITTAMVLKGGSCVLASDTLQRLYRELIMFNANGLNNTLKSLFKEMF